MNERLTATTRALCLSAAFFIASPLIAAEWEELPKLPEPNGGSICGASGSRIVIVGGTNWEGGSKHWLRAIHEYDPAKRKWEKAKDLHEGPVAYGMTFQTKDSNGRSLLSFIGGSDGEKPLKVFAPVDGIKTAFIPINELPNTLVLAAGGQLGERDIIVGGTNDAANIAGCTRAVHSIAWQDRSWVVTEMAYYPGKAFCIAASAVVSPELFIFGGANWDADKKDVVNASEAHAFNALKNEWRALKPLPFGARGMAALALDDHRIYIAGGFKSDLEGFTSDALLYDVKSGIYSPAKPLPYAATVALVALDEFVYCIGGEDKMKHRTDKFLRIAVSELLK